MATATTWDHSAWPPPTSTADVVATVPVSATVTATPSPSITLNFIVAGKYQIFRKDPAAITWGAALTTLTTDSTTWTDTTVSVGQLYEYKVIYTDGPLQFQIPAPLTWTGSYSPYGVIGAIGYILTGINVDETQPRGRVILVVTTDVQANLPTEYAQYVADLQADGWFVHVVPVAPATDYTMNGTGTKDAYGVPTAPYPNAHINIRNQIMAIYNQYPGQVKNVVLLGKVPACRTGSLLNGDLVMDPDGHGVNLSCYGADGYYANMTGTWTDLYNNEYNYDQTGKYAGYVTLPSTLYTNNLDGSVTMDPTLGFDPVAFNTALASARTSYPGPNGGSWYYKGYVFTLSSQAAGGQVTQLQIFPDSAVTVAAGTTNIPGDNKFDQFYMSQTGGEADMGFGRIDLSNGISGQYEALKFYLKKLHRYKTASPDFQPGRRVILRTGAFANIDETCWTMAYGVTGDKTKIDCISASELPAVSYTDADAAYSALHGPYLFYFKGNGGPTIGVGGKAVFWTGMQSHWGWWYSSTVSSGENSEALRLGENSFGLSWTWDIFGLRYFYHRMDMGFDTGDMMRVSINNTDATNGTYANTTDIKSTDNSFIEPCAGALFMNHIGDPTLRFFMFPPPTNLSVTPSGGQPILTWTASVPMLDSTEPSVIGYHVYRAPMSAGAVTGPYISVGANPITVTGTTYTDTDPTAGPGTGQWSYMVKAVRLETTGSGTYYNASLGAIQSIDQTNGPTALAISSPATLPSANWNTAYPTVLAATGGTPNYAWSYVSGTVPPGLTLNTNGSFSGLPTMAGIYTFTAKVTDAAGQSQQQTFSLTALSSNTVTLLPEVSSYVYSTAPTRVQGPTETMNVAGASTTNSFLRFNLAGQNFHNSFVSAILRVYVAPGTTANSIALLSAALTSDNYIAWLVANGAATKITSAVNNGSGFYRITSANHGLDPKYGLTATIAGITPTSPTNINGAYAVNVIDANTFDIPTLAYDSTKVWTSATSTPSNGITYNFQPQDNSAVAPVSATAFPIPYSTVDLDVTSLMKTCLANDPSGKIGFRLFTNSGQTIALCSAFSYGGAIPQLIIQTTDAPQIAITSPAANPAGVYVGSGLQLSATITAIPANAANLTQQWSMVSGPDTVTFGTPTLPNTTATFSAPGDYVLQLLANDSVLQSTQTVTVRVVSDPINGPTDNLTLHLPFSESSGAATADTSGSGNNGTLSGGASFSTSGYVGNALSTNGTSQAATVLDSASNPIDNHQAITISMWVNPTVLLVDASTVTLISKSGAFAISIRQQSNGGQVFNSIAGMTAQQSGKRLQVGTWTNITAVFNGATTTNTLQLYINGVPDIFTGSTTVTSVPRKAGVNTYIGGTSAADTHGFNGLIDEVRIYKRALTLAEIEDIAAGAPPDTGPVITTTPSLTGAVGSPLALSATVTSSKPPGSLSYNWSELNGPSLLSIVSPTSLATTTTPSAPGGYNLQFAANDGVVTTFANVAASITGQNYAGWAAQNNLTGNNALQTAIIANDGLNNLFKYALGLTPTTTYNPGDPRLPFVTQQIVKGANCLTLTFTGVATDVTYDVQASSDLTNWTSIQTFSNGTAPGTVTVPDIQAVGTTPKRFMRLVMTIPK